MGTNSKQAVQERREKILRLNARCYSQSEMMEELGVSRQTLSSDLSYLREQTRKRFFGLAKHETLYFHFYEAIDGVTEVQKEAWRIYRNVEENPEITQRDKMAALKILRECSETKFNMFINGPAFTQLDRLDKEMAKLKKEALEEINARNGVGMFRRPLTDQELEDIGTFESRNSPARDRLGDSGMNNSNSNLDDLDRP